jgi:hypothetical protein
VAGPYCLPPIKMSYSDLWKNNLRCRLTEKLAEGKLMHIRPPPLGRDFNGNTIFPKTRSFPPIPKDVTRLEVKSHDFPGSVGFHEGIRWLDISGSACDGEFHFPKSLEVLIWQSSNCPWYEGKFSHLPNLKQLDWSFRPITYLPELPKTLEVLQLANCLELTELPPLPEGLRVLDIRGCKKLKKLPDIPDSVQEIWYAGCKSLQPHGLWDGAENYWDAPKWIRAEQEKERKVRIQKRTRSLRQEIVAAAYHPRRVEKWLKQCGFDFLDVMLG